jgi:amino acid transporter
VETIDQGAPVVVPALEHEGRKVNWRQVAVVSIAGLGPASGMALNLQLVAQFAGSALVLAFLAAVPAIILMIYAFHQFARRISAAGGLYTWSAHAWGTSVGFVYGWTFVGAYFVLSAAGFAVFGGWMSEFFENQLHLNVPWWILSALALGYVIFLALRGIVSTLHAAVFLLGFEILILVVFSIYALFHTGISNWSTTPFKPSAVKGVAETSFGLAMTYAIFSYIGIEEGATLGAEVNDGHRDVGKGLWIAAIVVPILFLLVSYAAVTSYGIGNITAFAEDPAPLQTLSHKLWGGFGEAIIVLAVGSSILAWSQTAFNAGARVLYTLGEERVLPGFLSGTSKRGVPRTAIWVMAFLSLAIGWPMTFADSPFATYGNYGFLISIAFIVAYIVTCLGLIRMTLREGDFSWIRHGLPSLLGALFLAFPLYKTLNPWPVGVYANMTYVYFGWMAIGAAVLIVLRIRRPDIVGRVGTAMAQAEPEPSDAKATSLA